MSTPSRSEPSAEPAEAFPSHGESLEEPRPWATWGLVVLLLGFHGFTAIIGTRSGLTVVESLFYARLRWFRQLIGGQHQRLLDAGEWERLVSSTLVHADMAHLLLNTMAVLVAGTLLERLVGPVRVLTGFVLCGLGGSLASWWWGPMVSDGASGAVFGLLGMLIARGIRLRSVLDAHDRSVLLRWLPGFVALNLVLSGLLPFVDIVAHLGGFVAGLALGVPGRPERRGMVLEFLLLTLGVGWVLARLIAP